MLTTFLNTLRTQLRRPGMLVWVFAFPVILCTIFLFMFSGFSTDGVPDPVPVVVVTDSNWRGSSFSQVVDALSGSSADEALLDVTEAASADEARGMVEAGQAVGYLAVDAAGTPSLALARDAAGGLASSAFEADRSILDAVTSSYVRNEALVKAITQKDPSVLSDPAALARALGLSSGIERVRLTHGTPDETVRYYYALLGMAALMAAQSAAIAVTQLQPGEGGLGARLCASGTGRMRMLLGALLGSWAVSMLGLGLAFAFMRLVARIDFGGRDALCLLGLATSSLLATAIGAAIGAAPLRGGAKSRAGMVTALSCLASLFAGLYGEGAMQLSDSLAQAWPPSVWVNPARLITDQFYALYYYDSLAPFALRAAACVAASVALMGVVAALTVRSSHEHL